MYFLIVGDNENKVGEGTHFTILNKAHLPILGIFYSLSLK